jgi:hypothetical protein
VEQLEARRAHNPEVAGSNPVPATNKFTHGGIAQLARAFGSYPKGHRFDSCCRYQYIRPLGQAVKTPPFHGGNRGSIPLGVTIILMQQQDSCTGKASKPDPNTLTACIEWEHSSAGRAPALQAGGHRFEPCCSHHFGPVVQLVRMPACHAGGRGFESLPGRHLTKSAACCKDS